VAFLLVGETASTKWRANALGFLKCGYPLGYVLSALVVVSLWGWRSLYWLGISRRDVSSGHKSQGRRRP
jgi:hypothetical protein